MPDVARSVTGTGFGPKLLAAALVQGMRDTGAGVGAVYLLDPGERVLRLAVLSGVPWEIAAPWERAALGASTPVADALRGHSLVWLAGQEELARRYPQLALVLPYPFALGAAPITTDGTQWGGLVLHWPGSRFPQLRPRERDAIGDVSLGALLRDAADSGHPVKPGAGPCLVPPPGPDPPCRPRRGSRWTERLPGGCCGLDVDGRITFATTTAMELLGAGPSDLLGARPWEALP